MFDSKVAGLHSPKALNNALAISLWHLGSRSAEETYNRCLGDLAVEIRDNIKYLVIRYVCSKQLVS